MASEEAMKAADIFLTKLFAKFYAGPEAKSFRPAFRCNAQEPVADVLDTFARERVLAEAKWWHNCPADHKCEDYPERESCQRIIALEAQRIKQIEEKQP